MTDEDDWFERALREDDADADESAESDAREDAPDADAPGTETPETDTHDPDTPETDAHDPDTPETDAHDPDTPEATTAENAGDDAPDEAAEPTDQTGEFADAPAFDADADSDGEFGTGSTDDEGESPDSPTSASESGGRGFADADPYEDDAEDEGLFEEDFASAFENAPGDGPSPGGAGPDGGAGGGAGGGGGAAGGGFGGATQSESGGFGGGGGEFGMGGGDGGFGGGEPFEDEAFDDEEFESSIPRIDLGIDGLDSMIQGGVPERSLVTTIGSAGTGKTTFGLQFLHEALEQGENAVFITLEESHDRIVNTATEKGWDFEAYEEEGSLAVIDLDPIEMANSLTSIRNDLPRLVEDFGATRLVLDSVSLLEMMYDEQATRRNEIYDFTKSLKEAGVTTMLTSEASEDTPYASRHGIIEYLVDAVFVLRYIRSSDDFRETRLAVEIQKIRDANHSREIKPYSITNEGISVYRQANIF
ncbi:KaiC domain-containing protein [Halorussus gelatinilyticus]|uniref:KaiC domain-containing protein n=1 Tax=Halorussus gelatinilyticus TaxID=2937524 RepID=A0A8U0IL99_9EURY|nr:KaiC domain-containing protein [Halorussus gelatinilyticus]UPW00984.1 KaiC domain-containing protein [Halorussus gelatinilyticus]